MECRDVLSKFRAPSCTKFTLLNGNGNIGKLEGNLSDFGLEFERIVLCPSDFEEVSNLINCESVRIYTNPTVDSLVAFLSRLAEVKLEVNLTLGVANLAVFYEALTIALISVETTMKFAPPRRVAL